MEEAQLRMPVGGAELLGERTAYGPPTPLVVGGDDEEVLGLDRRAAQRLAGEYWIEMVPGAGHLFEEPGALDEVARPAGDWFTRCLAAPGARRS